MEQTSLMTEKIRDFFSSRFADAVISEDNFRDQQSFYVKPEAIFDICQTLLNDAELDLKYLSDITSLDWLGDEEAEKGRFEVVYNLYSLTHHNRLFLKVRLQEDNPRVRTVSDLWAGASCMEREVWDLMGIDFEGHPDMTKVLTADELDGHPLRKDFPLTWEQPKFTWNKDDPPEVIK